MSPPINDDDDDDELRRRFAELKAQDARTAPSFEKTRAAAMTITARRPKTSPLVFIVPVTMSFAAAAVILLFLVFQRADSAQAPSASQASPAAAAAMGGERVLARRAIDPAPLDFLLDTSLTSERRRARADITNPIRGW